MVEVGIRGPDRNTNTDIYSDVNRITMGGGRGGEGGFKHLRKIAL